MVRGTPQAVPDKGAKEEGQAMVEYALILGLVALATVSALTFMGQSVQAMLQAVADMLAAAMPGG
jgi:Flp pilus assembly pilin Flp